MPTILFCATLFKSPLNSSKRQDKFDLACFLSFFFLFLLQDSPDTNREQIVKLSVSGNTLLQDFTVMFRAFSDFKINPVT